MGKALNVKVKIGKPAGAVKLDNPLKIKVKLDKPKATLEVEDRQIAVYAPPKVDLLSDPDIARAHRHMLKIRRYINQTVLEREAETDSALVAVLSGESCFFIGDAGAAKSMQIRVLCKLFDLRLFEILMSETTKPEQLFGPVDVPALAKGRQVNKIDGYAPTAEVLFLDEVFKASDIVLNPMLGILNEHTFNNGDDGMIRCPTITSFAASNEVPTDKSSRPIYDRFLIRHSVEYIRDYANLNKLFHMVTGNMEVSKPDPLPRKDVDLLREAVRHVEFEEETFHTVVAIRDSVKAGLGVEISDRRLGKSISILKAVAFLNGRSRVEIDDLDMLANVFWDSPDQIRRLRAIVASHTATVSGDVLSYQETADGVFAYGVENPGEIEDQLVKLEKMATATKGLSSQAGKNVHRSILGHIHRLTSLMKGRRKIKVIRLEEGNGHVYFKLDAVSAQMWNQQEIRSIGFKFSRTYGYWWMTIASKKDEEALANAARKNLGAKVIVSLLEGL